MPYIGYLLTADGVKPDPSKGLLKYYEPDKPLVLQRDANEKDLRASLAS